MAKKRFKPVPRKLRYAAAAIAIGVLTILPLDYLLLRGKQVASASVPLSRDETDSLSIVDIGETHLLEILTRRKTRGARRRIAYRLIGPSGAVVVEAKELRSRTRRYVRFTPQEAGTYVFEANNRGLFETSASAVVRVTVNDRRLIQWVPWY